MNEPKVVTYQVTDEADAAFWRLVADCQQQERDHADELDTRLAAARGVL